MQAAQLQQHPPGLPVGTGVTGTALPSLGALWRAGTGLRSAFVVVGVAASPGRGSEGAEGQAGG